MNNLKIALLVTAFISLNCVAMEQQPWYENIQRAGNRVTATRMPDGASIAITYDPRSDVYFGNITERRPYMQGSGLETTVVKPIPSHEVRALLEQLTAPVEKG